MLPGTCQAALPELPGADGGSEAQDREGLQQAGPEARGEGQQGLRQGNGQPDGQVLLLAPARAWRGLSGRRILAEEASVRSRTCHVVASSQEANS